MTPWRALISLGHTAQESMRVNPSSREEPRRLPSIYGTTAALSAVIDDRVTLLALVGHPARTSGFRRKGAERPGDPLRTDGDRP